ncbi:hypothetical protein HCN44_010626 [Aphidius gifuensis]|uniref:Hexosyltransferase n=1 Tax=Aphidius gifuensis TaxID=684658 RepID=A0A834XTQ1_APHGI|nr:hypothetical protein HCN44_010626 [Aphidius gifuensis]
MPKNKNNEYRMRIEYEEWPIEKSRNLSDYIQPETETTILTPRLNFNTTKTFISIIMTSNPENLNQRKKIRMSIDMMKNYNGNNVVVNFFIGLSKNSTINKELKQESDYYNDIIQESFDDSFYNSTIRDGMILKWVTKNCQNTKYIMITHDDIYINIENLIQSIFDQEKYIVGGSLLMGRLKDWEQPVKKPFDQWSENIKQESRKFKDIIQENFYDSIYNSTIRVGMILKWIKKNCNNKNVKYIMITNDDVYINIINLIQSILSHENNRAGRSLLMGRLREWEEPVKDPSDPWYIPDYEYNDRYYPFFLDSSLGYVMSTNIAKKLYEISLTETFIHFGGIFFTGICAKKAGLILTHNANFTKDCLKEFKECYSVITCLNGCKKN